MTALVSAQTAPLELVGEIANAHAAAASFLDYRSRKSPQTLRRHDAALSAFCCFLSIVRLEHDPRRLAADPSAWHGMTWDIGTPPAPSTTGLAW